MSELEQILKELETAPPPPMGRVVRRMDNTEEANPQRVAEGAVQYSGVDALFGDKLATLGIKHEKPEHRMMLWLKLQCHSNKEVAQLTGYSAVYVGQVVKQPWFREAFCKLSTHFGKDAVQTYLEGEVLPAIQGIVDLSTTADSDAVKLAAKKEILDRFLGKAVAKSEVKVQGDVNHAVYDADKLLKESARLNEQLRTRMGGMPSVN